MLLHSAFPGRPAAANKSFDFSAEATYLYGSVDPVVVKFGGFIITWFGILTVVGALAGIWTASRRAPRHGIPAEVMVDLAPWLVLSGIVGARIAHVLFYWQEEFAGRPFWEIFKVNQGGLVFYGGLAGGLLAAVLYIRARGLPFWKLADICAPSIALGQVFGRIGCFLNGCCYGTPTQLPWVVHYPGLAAGGVHPVQLYEAALNLGLFGFLARRCPRKAFEGEVAALYVTIYAGLRFLVEFFRGDYGVKHLGDWATSGQLMSLGLLAFGVWLYRLLGRRALRDRPSRA